MAKLNKNRIKVKKDDGSYVELATVDDLAAVDTAGTGSETVASVKTKYESNSDTNAFTDAEKSAVANIGTGTLRNKDTIDNALLIDDGVVTEAKLSSATQTKLNASASAGNISDFGPLGSVSDDTAALNAAFSSSIKVINLENKTLQIASGTVTVSNLVKTFVNGVIELGSGTNSYMIKATDCYLTFNDVLIDGKSLCHTGLWMLGGTLDCDNQTINNIGEGTNSAYGWRLDGVSGIMINPKAINYSADQIGRFILQTTSTTYPDSRIVVIGGHLEEISSTVTVDSDAIGQDAFSDGNPPVMIIHGTHFKNAQKRYFKANTGIVKMTSCTGFNDKYDMRAALGIHQLADRSVVDNCEFISEGAVGRVNTMIKLGAYPSAIGYNVGTKITNNTVINRGTTKGLEAVIEMDGEIQDFYLGANTAVGFKNLVNGISDATHDHANVIISNNKISEMTSSLVQFLNIENLQVTGNIAPDIISTAYEVIITGARKGVINIDNPSITTSTRPVDAFGVIANADAKNVAIETDMYVRVYNDASLEFYGFIDHSAGTLTEIDASEVTLGTGVLDGSVALAEDIGVSYSGNNFYMQNTSGGFVFLDVFMSRRRMK